MPTKIVPRRRKPDTKALYTSLTKAIVLAIPAAFSLDPLTGLKTGSSAINHLIDCVMAFRKDTADELSKVAWDITRASFVTGLSLFLQKVDVKRRPAGGELETLIDAISRRFDLAIEQTEYVINIESFVAPLLLPPVREASTRIPHEMSIFEPVDQPLAIRRLFESCMIEGLKIVRDRKPELFKVLESHLESPFAIAMEKANALANHRTFLVRSFTQTPIFGQEQSGITLSNLYVRQRCLWYTVDTVSESRAARDASGAVPEPRLQESRLKLRRVSTLHLDDMHAVVHKWLAEKKPSDSVRVVAGGPGSGKSTFAKAVAIEIFDQGSYDVLFVPLQEISSRGSFETRLASLFHSRTDLGFDRVDNPLTWLARSQYDGSAPLRPLLMICDGLDEIAPPDSAESINVTTDFIQSLNTWIGGRNAAGCYAKAIILGRNIAAKEAFGKLGIDDYALLNVGGLIPLVENKDWKDRNQKKLAKDMNNLAAVDQRLDYWLKWAACNSLDEGKIPETLNKEKPASHALKELTTEPLLMYLLLWTGYLGDKWREVADNKNVVYEEIFKRIYQRDWGKGPNDSKRDAETRSGGHSGIKNLTFDDFMLLQEALGLASWQTGGRTATKSVFDKTLKSYLTDIKLHQLRTGPGITLKSVALQSYTRSAEDDAGYEFVHKSLSDYLIGRGLVRNLTVSVRTLAELAFDERCKSAASSIAKIAYAGAMSLEIANFFSDELRLRSVDIAIIRAVISSQFLPLCNWILANGFPIHELDLFGREVGFVVLEQAQRRAMDVLWTFGQSLALQAYPENEFQSEGEHTWDCGPIKLDWPTSTSAYGLFSKLSDRDHCAENGRLATFHRLDLSNQVFTDTSMGSVVFTAEAGQIRPSVWLGLKASGCKFDSAAFYCANMRVADLSLCQFKKCAFNSSVLIHANLRRSAFISCRFPRANSSSANYSMSTFRECQLQGADFRRCDFSETSFYGTQMGKPSNLSVRENELPHVTTFIAANFHGAMLANADFGEADFESAVFDGANLSKVNMSRANMKKAELDGAVIDGVTISKAQARRGVFTQNIENILISESGRASAEADPDEDLLSDVGEVTIPR